MAHRLVLFVAVLLAACGPAGDPAGEYVAAYNTFSVAIDAAVAEAGDATDIGTHKVFLADLAAAAETFANKLDGIDFPAAASADAATLSRAVVVARQRAAGAATVTDEDVLATIELEVRDALRAVSDAAAILEAALR